MGELEDSKELERRVLREIGAVSDRIRELRNRAAAENRTQIAALELRSRQMWQQLRALRVGPAARSDPAVTT